MLLVMVTYTHNDAELLNGLLREVSRWSVAPSHIFVIDDASDTPYVLPLELKSLFGGSAALSAQMEMANELAKQADFANSNGPGNSGNPGNPGGPGNSNRPGEPCANLPGLDVIRPAHLGPAQAKSYGLNLAFDAGADIVLSIDCDVRLPRHWLKEALNIAGQPAVGLVGSDLRHGLAGDVLSGYLRNFEQVPRNIVSTQFLGAGVWLLRKDVWQASGGLAGHEQYTHEDLYFSKLLKDMNLELIAHNDPPGTQVRRLRRSAYFNRELRYLGFAILGVSKSKGIETALSLILERSAGRLAEAEKLNQPGFVYVELLWISSLLFYLAARGALPAPPQAACEAVRLELKNLLDNNYPNISGLLQEDLEAMHLVQADFCVSSFPVQAFNLEAPDADEADEADEVNGAKGAKLCSEGCEEGYKGEHPAACDAVCDEALALVRSLVTAILNLWKKHPQAMQVLEEKQIALIKQEDDNFEFSTHYLEEIED